MMVFQDPSGRRWRMARAVGLALLLLAGMGCAAIVAVVASAPTLAPIPADWVSVHDATPVWQPMVSASPILTSRSLAPAAVAEAHLPVGPAARKAFAALPFLRSAFVIQDDARSIASLKANLSRINLVFPDWYAFDAEDGTLHERVDGDLRTSLASSTALVFPRVANTDAAGAWHGDELSQLFADVNATDQFIDELSRRLTAQGARGVNLDIEDIRQDQKQAYVQWLDRVADALHERGLLVTVDVPMNDEESFDYEAISGICDAVVLMAYDEHYPSGKPGAIAGREWYADGLGAAVSGRIAPEKLIVALGAYGYDWTVGLTKGDAEAITFEQAMQRAAEQDVDVETDSAELNSSFAYTDDSNHEHQVWFLDAVSAWNQYHALREAKARGVALWRAGSEEPAVWDILCSEPGELKPQALARVRSADAVQFRGEGEMLRVAEMGHDGLRKLSLDGKLIDYAAYERFPASCRVEKFGKGTDRQVALTFDDGPDPKWTPQVLDILARENVQATFFVVGDQVQRFPDIVRQAAAQGHLIGNHTFSHPDIRLVTPARFGAELNATQRLIEWTTGRQTLLLRTPFDTDSAPTVANQLAPLYQACQMGYIVAAADVDSADYLKPGVDAIVQNVLRGLKESGSNIVVFHDAGGDRRQTVEALARLVPLLKSQGYEFVTLGDLLGASAAEVMPAMTRTEKAMAAGAGAWVAVRAWGWKAISALFLVTTAIAILRIMLLGWLVLSGARRAKRLAMAKMGEKFEPLVRALIPAYNEEKVIRCTLDAILASDYPHLAVTVIDDGSTDRTAEIVAEFCRRDPRVILVRQANAGKSAALNRGFFESAESFLVTIDGDTIVQPQTVRELISPFSDSTVDAVCGNVQVGNVRNVLTAFQNVEYVTSQNYDRRAFDLLNCISVVPGATGAWRRREVLRVGGYSSRTLTEDADLTISLLRAGGRVVYAPLARSITEAPECARTLFKQRFRWSFGTFQCLWKHRDGFGKGSLGWVALPNMLLFQVVFPVLAPIGDLILVLCLLRGDLGAIASGYLMFLAMDLVGSAVAFHLDRKTAWSLAVLLIQRFYYRQFMYIVTLSGLLAALRGGRHGWNKLERKGTMVHHAQRKPDALPAAEVAAALA